MRFSSSTTTTAATIIITTTTDNRENQSPSNGERQQILTLAEVVSILERRIDTLILEVQSLKQELIK
jgi:hypothetical protein